MKKWILAALISACVLSGCGESEVPSFETAEPTLATILPTETEPTQLLETVGEGFSYSEISDLEFFFSSGAGGWATVLTVEDHGGFTGSYSDSDMGVTGEDYPNGTRYYCDFMGSFGQPEKINDYTYRLPIDSLVLMENPGEEEIREGVLLVASEPFGLTETEELLLYLPGAPVDQLPRGYLDWVRFAMEENTLELPFCGLYNPGAETGFSGHPRREPYSWQEELLEMENRAAALEYRLTNDPYLSQQGMNDLARELYQLWDDKLNSLWAELGKRLDSDAMASLTQEQLRWIEEKETAAKAAGETFGDGSLRPVQEYRAAAELTRQRVYDLLYSYFE